MKWKENHPNQNEDIMDSVEERESGVEQRGGSMREPLVVAGSEIGEPEIKKKRRFTAQRKLEILREADLCKGKPGATGALLRREGLYSSALGEWRKQRERGAFSALSQKRGRKPKATPEVKELKKIERECKRLREQNRQLRVVLEAQKKMSEILGIEMVDTRHLDEQEE